MEKRYFSEEHKRKISEAKKGKPSPMKGKHHSEETKRKMSIIKMGNKCFLGHTHTIETRQKISKAHQGLKHPHGEETKKRMSEAKKGVKNPAWRGGKSFEPYSLEWTEKLRESIRERDGRICQKCSKTEKQEIIEEGQKLSIHHINYNKGDCKKENLVTLCKSCNSKANSQRSFWLGYFMGKMGIKITYKQFDLFK